MATIADELNAISVEHGYTGAAPKTIAGAIDALADTLAGTDVEGKRTIAGAVKALAPYIGSGGGGGSLGSQVTITANVSNTTYPSMFVSLEQFDLSGETQQTIFDAAMGNCIATAPLSVQQGLQAGGSAASGAYVLLMGTTTSEVLASNIAVQVDGQTVTTGYEAKVLFESNRYFAFVTMQVPQAQTVDVALTAPIG